MTDNTDIRRTRYDFRGVCADCGQKPDNWDEHDGWHRGLTDTLRTPRALGGALVRELDERAAETDDETLRGLLNRAGDHIEFLETDAHYRGSAPRTLPTREQIAEVIYNSDDGSDNSWSALREGGVLRGRYLELADAVLALIDKENTMPEKQEQYDDGEWSRTVEVVPEDTITVPRKLIDRVLHNDSELDEEAAMDELAALLDPPKPRAPRLRVVNLDDATDGDDRGVAFITLDYLELEAQPDVLTVLGEAIDAVAKVQFHAPAIGDLIKSRIRAALEGK